MNSTVLCIDDDPHLLMLYWNILQEHGYDVLIESNGRDGLVSLGLYPVDCIVLDYQMPGMDGAEFLQRVRSRCLSTPVILISGCSEIPPQVLTRVDAFIEKPVGIGKLLECVESLTRGGASSFTDQGYSHFQAWH